MDRPRIRTSTKTFGVQETPPVFVVIPSPRAARLPRQVARDHASLNHQAGTYEMPARLSERHARRVFRRRYSSELPAPTRTRVALPCTTFAGSRRFYLTHTPTLRGFNHVGDLRRRTGIPTRPPQSFPD